MHVRMWSDVDPATIIAKTRTTVTVRYDKAEPDQNRKSDYEQKWIITEDLNGETEVFRWSRRSKCYKNKTGSILFPEWRKYYDYSF